MAVASFRRDGGLESPCKWPFQSVICELSNGNPALKRWAWCNHDKDKVREENIEQLRLTDPLKEYHIGDDRPARIHLALEFANAVYNTLPLE